MQQVSKSWGLGCRVPHPTSLVLCHMRVKSMDVRSSLCRQSSEPAAPAVLSLPSVLHLFFSFPREWDFDLKKLPNIKMRKVCANDAVPKKRKQKPILNIDKDLGELDLTGDPGDSEDGKLEPTSEASESDEEMTPVPACS